MSQYLSGKPKEHGAWSAQGVWLTDWLRLSRKTTSTQADARHGKMANHALQDVLPLRPVLWGAEDGSELSPLSWVSVGMAVLQYWTALLHLAALQHLLKTTDQQPNKVRARGFASNLLLHDVFPVISLDL